MSVSTGRKGWVGVAVESAPGTPSNPDRYVPFLECSLMERHTPIGDVSARGIRDEQADSQVGKRWGEGNLRINLDPTIAPTYIGAALGTFGSPSDQGSGVYEHTLSRNNSNTPKTLSHIFDRVTDRLLFPYGVVNSLELSFEDALAEINMNMMSKEPVTSASGTLTTTSGTLFAFRHASIGLGTAISDAEAATPLKIRSFNLTINNNSELQFVAGNRTADSIINKNFQVTGSFRLAFENTTQRDYFTNLTKNALVVTFTGNGIGGGLSEYVKFRLYKIRVDEHTVDTPIDDYISEEISFVAEYDSDNSATMDALVQNRTSAYE